MITLNHLEIMDLTTDQCIWIDFGKDDQIKPKSRGPMSKGIFVLFL